MTLNIYKDMLDKMDLTQPAIEFVRGDEYRQRVFGIIFIIIIENYIIDLFSKKKSKV